MTTITKPDTNYATAEEAMQATLEFAKDKTLGSDYVARPQLDFYETTAQGDINITRLQSLEDLPKYKEVKPFSQLAPGTSKGSRHCIDLDTCFNSNGELTAKFYNLITPNPIQGPVFENTQETLITHPEHGDQVLPPGLYFVSYQTQHAEELKRIQD